MTITKSDYKLYHTCLTKYKNHLREKYSDHNKKKEKFKKELDKIIKIKDDFDNLYGGKRIFGRKYDIKAELKLPKQRGKTLKKCVFKYAKALDKEEKELTERLARIKIERRSLKHNLNQVVDL